MTGSGAHFRIMTYNVGGGRKDFGSVWDNVIQTIGDLAPDILLLQETVEWQDLDGREYRAAHEIAHRLGFADGVFFGPTLSLRQNFHPQKTIFVDGLFQDFLDWRQGNAVLSRWGFSRLGDPLQPGTPWNLPLFRPPLYEGNRDTDPRFATLSRVKNGAVAPFVIGTHWSTLVGERGSTTIQIPGKTELAQAMRQQQAEQLIRIIRRHVLDTDAAMVLAGDFNAPADEPCIAQTLIAQAGLTRLEPVNPETPTHLFKVREPIDHIFVYPKERLLRAECRTVDTPTARQASDHLPVVADIWLI